MHFKYSLHIFIFYLCCISVCAGQSFSPLYEKGAVPNWKPNALTESWTVDSLTGSQIVTHVAVPEIQVFLPEKDRSNGTAVIICPGGAYMKLGMNHTGSDIARSFNQWGITAFVLKYRLPNAMAMIDGRVEPFQDLRRAMQWVKERAGQFSIDSTKLGVAGFSAGGHLASAIGTSFRRRNIDLIPEAIFRPAFMILGCPVISFVDSLTNRPSKETLLGKNVDDSTIYAYSNEKHVDADTPPVFIFHASDDKSVPVASSLLFYKALLKKNVPVEMHLFSSGGHSFGFGSRERMEKWFQPCIAWMKTNGWIP